MNLFYQKDIKILLIRHNIKPSKGLGQNFLINKGIFEKIIKAADLTKEDLVLEIGPGIGNLTEELAKRVKQVIAVEKDRKMVEILKATFKNHKNVEIVSEDILKLKIKELFKKQPYGESAYWRPEKLKIKNFKIVANLPYYITSPIIRKFLEIECPPQLMVFTVQKEVAQRICAKPRKMSLLAVSVQFYAKPEIISYVKKENFWPKPKVDSAIIKITTFSNYRERVSATLFFKVVKAGFSHPRKQLANNLAEKLDVSKEKVSEVLRKTKINPSQRAETLTVEEWIELSQSLRKMIRINPN